MPVVICRVSLSSDVTTVLEYALASRDRQGRLRGSMTRLGGPAGKSFDGVVRLFDAHKRLRPSLGRHVGHASLRLSPRDRRLTRDEWRRAARHLARGFGAEIWTVIKHGDDHVHVLWSRIRRDGEVVDHRHDRRCAEMLTREIERDLSLERVQSSWQLDRGRAPAAARVAVPEARESVKRLMRLCRPRTSVSQLQRTRLWHLPCRYWRRRKAPCSPSIRATRALSHECELPILRQHRRHHFEFRS